jgi:hypothetical protein
MPRLIRALKPFFHGSRWHRVEDSPFEVDESRAIDLVKSGLAEFVVKLEVPPIDMAIFTAAAAAEKAVGRRQKRA